MFFTRGANPVDLLILAECCAAANQTRPDLLSFAFQAVEDCAVHGSEITAPTDANSYVLVSQNYLVCVFAATSDWRQWIGHALGSQQSPVVDVPGKVGIFFSLVATNSYANIKQVIQDNHAGRQVVCCGHSLGGATAQIVATLIEHDYGINPKVFTFGSPRVGDAEFSYSFAAGQVVRIEEVGDPVVGLPPTLWSARVFAPPFPTPVVPCIYAHAGQGFSLDSTGLLEDYQLPATLTAARAWFNGQDITTPHFINTYTTHLATAVRGAADQTSEADLQKPDNVSGTLKQLQSITGVPYGFIPLAVSPGDPAYINQLGVFGMATFSATFFFNLPSSGWTERYFMSAADPTVVAAKAQDLAKARIGLCGEGVAIENVRISDEAVKRDYGLFPLSFGTEADSTEPTGHSKSFQALVINLVSGQYRNRVFLRGIGMANYLGDKKVNVMSDFTSKFNNWKSRLKSDGWLMRVQSRFEANVNYAITNITTATPPVVTFAAGLGIATGDQAVLTGVKGMKAANGTFFVNKLTDTTLSLRGVVPDQDYIGAGSIRKKSLIYLPINDCTIIKETSRKAGKNSGQSVGRRRAR